MAIKNVSGRARSAGSDYDLEVWFYGWLWHLLTRLCVRLGIGSFKRPLTYRLHILVGTLDVELFLIDREHPDTVTVAAGNNARLQWTWDTTTFAAYCAAKAQIAHLTGSARKAAKAVLAVQFGLNPIVYQGA